MKKMDKDKKSMMNDREAQVAAQEKKKKMPMKKGDMKKCPTCGQMMKK